MSRRRPTPNCSGPKVFKAVKWDVGEQRGALLMESFVGRSAALGYDATFNSDQLFNMARYLAKLHKYFLCLPEEDWKGKYSTDILEWFSEADFFEPCFQKLKIYRPGVFDEGIRVFGKYGKNKKFLRYTAYGVHKDLGLPAVLTHGDKWPNNLLWKTNADGAVSNDLAAIIDWQSIHESSMTADIARILVMCIDGHIRREYQYKVLQYYYDTLIEELKAEGKSLEVTFEQMIIGPFAFPDRDWTEQEAAVNEPKLDRILKRAKEAMDDGLELLKDLPLESFQ